MDRGRKHSYKLCRKYFCYQKEVQKSIGLRVVCSNGLVRSASLTLLMKYALACLTVTNTISVRDGKLINVAIKTSMIE
jgi:hypothetical protein